MFTGIVEELGTVRALRRGGAGARLEIDCALVVSDAGVGDSISVNGCCVTVTASTDAGFSSDLMGETLDRTALASVVPGDAVNLERSLRADARLGGHLVQGHVDAVGVVAATEDRGQWTVLTVTFPEHLAPYIVEKGSITVEGASLTVMETGADTFAVGLIPHTMSVTTLGRKRPGDRVNLEVDVVAKYVERMLRGGVPSPYDTSP